MTRSDLTQTKVFFLGTSLERYNREIPNNHKTYILLMKQFYYTILQYALGATMNMFEVMRRDTCIQDNYTINQNNVDDHHNTQ
jgi:hypothetical protein